MRLRRGMLTIRDGKHVLRLLLLEIHEHVIGRGVLLGANSRLLHRGTGDHWISRGGGRLGVVG